MLHIVNIVGARPNFMKIAPLVREMRKHTDLTSTIVHTGQHYDENLSKVFFDDLGIPKPDINLGVGSGSREEQIHRIREAFRPVAESLKPQLLLVVGDVNSTIACASVAKDRGIKVAHVEAGLRSFDMSMPEEHNRRETDEISDYLFVTEASGLENLQNENTHGQAFMVGNVMIDSLASNLARAKQSSVLGDLDVAPGEYFVSTFHRPSNVDSADDVSRIVTTVKMICERAKLVLPIHPRTRHSMNEYQLWDDFSSINNLRVTEPLGYLDFLCLLSHAKGAITDSGGIQEETTYLGVPCLTMRDNTERPATIDMGTNLLIGSDQDRLIQEIDNILTGRFKTGTIPPLWDGHASTRIVEILRREMLGIG